MSEPDAARRIPDPGFAADDGSASAELSAALDAWATDPTAYADVLAVLQRSRLLVPVVAVLGEVEYDEAGLAHDKTSDMATVLLRGGDGRLALLAFTGTTALNAWDPAARPVPVGAPLAAQSALQDGAAALAVDVAGPVAFVVEGEDLEGLAQGWTLARVGSGTAWIRSARESSVTIQR
jgi:SseB protein N-terminal domain